MTFKWTPGIKMVRGCRKEDFLYKSDVVKKVIQPHDHKILTELVQNPFGKNRDNKFSVYELLRKSIRETG